MITTDAGLITALTILNIPYTLERTGAKVTAYCDDPDIDTIERLYFAGKIQYDVKSVVETYKAMINKMRIV